MSSINTPDCESIFESFFGHYEEVPYYGKKYIEAKIKYFEKTGVPNPTLYLDSYMYENYDEFKKWLSKNNKILLYEDLEFGTA